MLADLKILIDDFIERKGWTLHSLAIKAGVGYSTLRGYYALRGNPRWNTVSEILDVVTSPSTKLEFMEKHFPRQARYFSPRTRYEGSVTREHIDSDLKNILQSEPHNRLFNMASTDGGLTLEQTRRVAGDMGVKAVTDLVDAGIIKESDGVYYTAAKYLFSLSCWRCFPLRNNQ